MSTGISSGIKHGLSPVHLRSERTIEIVIAEGKRSNGMPHSFLFDCWLGNSDRFLCTSRQPFLDAARVLVSQGYHPNTILILRHAGSSVEALRASLQVAARLTVDEFNGTRFARWKSFLISAGSTRRDEAADEVTTVSDRNLALPSDVPSRRVRIKTSKSWMYPPKPSFDCRSVHLRGVTREN